MENFEVIREDGFPIKAWIKGVPLEDVARQQLINTATLPFIHKHIAVMPDVHWGMGSTIGSVIPTKGAIIPAAVGVDIGCGMMAVQTNLMANHLPDNLSKIRSAIEAAVPHGRTDNGGKNDCGAWRVLPDPGESWHKLSCRFSRIIEKHPELQPKRSEPIQERALKHLGTLGSGNHFIEVCLDEDDHVWVMLHSGSRGCGNRIGRYFIEKAKRDMERWFINLPDKNLAYLVEGSKLFDDYVEAVGWAQDYALENRKRMMSATLNVIRLKLGRYVVEPGEEPIMAVNCHHNYVTMENHFGANVWVTRKGAVRARKGDLGIIPGSMGVCSYIVRGKGNPMSFNSCAHGAGRAMSRGQAKKQFSLEDHVRATEGVECRKDKDVVDETPGAYKDIDAVMAAQTDLVEIVHTLKQVICVKG